MGNAEESFYHGASSNRSRGMNGDADWDGSYLI